MSAAAVSDGRIGQRGRRRAPAKRAATSVCPFQTLQGARAKGADQESGLTDQARGAMAARATRKDAMAQREGREGEGLRA